MSAGGGTRAALVAIVTVVLAFATAGLTALVRAGVCLHQLSAALDRPHPMMDGMVMSDTMTSPDAACPVLVYAALVAGASCLFAFLSLLALRPSASIVSAAAAALVVRTRFGPLTAALCLAGSVPLATVMVLERAATGVGAIVFAAALVALAAATALGLLGIARVVLAFAHRLTRAIVAAFRQLRLSVGPTRFVAHAIVPASAGAHLARRRAPRAPPARI